MQLKFIQGDEERREGIYYEYDPFSKPIGEGGMGVVYKGFRVNASTGVRHVVAIKAMKDGLPDEVYERARREAGIRMKNDNLIEMMGFVTTIEKELGGRSIQRYYVISEFLVGVVLTELLKGNFKNSDGIEVDFAKQLYNQYINDREITSVRIIKRVLAGIMALHDRGYIHRDIDPSNIMVTKEGNLKMIDFGIAKYVGELRTQDSSRTATGKFIGKAEYASPELVLGSVRDQHYTTDIYAIGILFYQLLVGKLPFDGPQYDILQAQLKKKLPLNKIPYREYRPIIKKATAKRQSERYQSCVEMRHAIDNPSAGFDWNMMGKVVAGLAVLCVCGFGGYWVLHKEKETEVLPDTTSVQLPPPLPPKSPSDEQFDKAIRLLESHNMESVREGWTEMKQLVDSNYGKAKNVVGITYYPDSDMLTDEIKKRRKDLNLDYTQSEEKSFEMLNSIRSTDDITGEGLAILGHSYFRKGEYKKAAEMLSKAQKRLNPKHQLYKPVLFYLDKSKD